MRFDTFLLDSEASIPFLGPMSATWTSLPRKVWSANNTDLAVSSDSTPDPRSQSLHFVRFQVIYMHAHVWETLVHDMNISFNIIRTTLLETGFLLEARKKKTNYYSGLKN